MLVSALINLHDWELFWEAGLNVVIHIDQIFGGKFGLLNDANQVLLVSQFLFEPQLDGLLDHGSGSLPHDSLLALGLERLVVGLNDFDCSFQGFWFFLGILDAVGEGEKDAVKKSGFEVIDFDKLLPHDCSLALPG